MRSGCGGSASGPNIHVVICAHSPAIDRTNSSVDDDNARSLILIGGAIWNSLTMPDLRTWTTLPATQQAAVLPRPADGRLQFRVPSSSTPVKTVTVPPGPSFVYARWTGVGELAIQSVSLSARRRNSMEENP